MLIVNVTHIHMYLSLKIFIVISIIICPVNNNSYINFFLFFFSDKFLAFSGPHNKSRIENGNY